MPDGSGLELLEKIKSVNPLVPVIVITAFEDNHTTIKAMQLGAFDYMSKPLDLERFSAIVQQAIDGKNLSDRLTAMISLNSESYTIENSVIGKVPAMKDIFKRVGQVSLNRVNVLIQGESGTGKELISKVIHHTGITKDHPFIAVNCTALAESILESELFGHSKGAFTGAIRDKRGKFELAAKGTIFLDEISEISPDLQVKLLRVLQERNFERVGGEDSIIIKSRIIAATNRNLKQLVDDGKFREDLYYRLNVFTINLPPLRERKEDIPELVIYLLNKINKELHKNVRKVPFEVMEMLQSRMWIGNVRELENALLQAVVLAKGDVLESELLPFPETKIEKPKNNSICISLEEVERNHIEAVLKEVQGNKQKACDILGISKPTLYSKISRYKIDN
jgi:two-component system response regulator AtoC